MDREFTILLAEDDPPIREVVVEILREHGFRVLVAEGGDEALRLLIEHQVDLLLTDVVMPGANGFDLALHAKSIRPNLRLLYMTGHYAEHAADKGILYGRVIRFAQGTAVPISRWIASQTAIQKAAISSLPALK